MPDYELAEGGAVHLVSFSVQNFRSITKAHRLGIAQSTVLIGPNNEGKSNILRAMVTALRILTYVPAPEAVRSKANARLYDWTRDFPVPLQAAKPNGESVFTLEFELTPDDVEDFGLDPAERTV